MRSSAALASHPDLQATLWAADFRGALDLYRKAELAFSSEDFKFAAARRELGLIDRYYLLLRLLRRRDVLHPWIYARCREVEADPDGHLDLWFRGAYKSTLITYAGAIQEILRDPEITIGIFSHTRPIAKAFLIQIKREFESNETLKRLYPAVLYANPQRESPGWSEDGGIIVKRKSNPKEATVEAWGLIDGQPTAKHFGLRIYDDVVTRESVTTPEQIAKTTEALDLSQNLGIGEAGRAWYIGTTYSFADTYQAMIDRGGVRVRKHPRTGDGTLDGTPIMMSPEAWAAFKAENSESIVACQQLINPLAGSQAMFNAAWIDDARVEVRPDLIDVFIVCDPAGSRKRGSDNTAMAVLGVDDTGAKYLLDGLCHKLDLAGRWSELTRLYAKWRGIHGVLSVNVGYERYGMQADLEYFDEKMRESGQHSFTIRELAWPREGPGSKEDRVQRLVPDAKQGRFHLPAKCSDDSALRREMRAAGTLYRLMLPIRVRDHDGNVYDLAERFVQEITLYPLGGRDDLVDAVSRIYDMDTMGAKRVFAVDERIITSAPVQVPAAWPQICGLYFVPDGSVAAVWLAIDRDRDTAYVVDTYSSRDRTIALHAAAIKSRGAWVPVAWPDVAVELPGEKMGPQIAKQYRDHGLKMRPEAAKFALDQRNPEQSRSSREAGISAMLARMQIGKLRAFSHLGEWFEDLRACRREGGKLPKSGGRLLSATRIAMMDLRYAVVRQPARPLMAETQPLDRTVGY